MSKNFGSTNQRSLPVVIFILASLLALPAAAQQLSIRDFVLFGGNGNCPGTGQLNPPAPGCGVQIGTSGTVLSGKVGSYTLVQTTGNASIAGDINCAGKVILSNSNSVGGNIYVGSNTVNNGAAILQAGSNASFTNLYINGNVNVSGGSVSGTVIHPSGTTYTGPAPAGGQTFAAPPIPAMPAMPGIANFPAAGTTNITNTQTVNPLPSTYGAIMLGGNKTLTFAGPGEYVFSKIKNSGNTNQFVFDFQNSTTGDFHIDIHGDVDLYKINVKMINGGSASRIFMEVHGNGSTAATGNYAWMMTNGASGNNQTVWYGTVWAPYGGINVGSGSSPSKVIGALWSGTQVILDNGVSITHAMYDGCNTPNVNAGPDRSINCANPSTQLNGTSSTQGVQYNWSVVNGNFSSSIASPTVTAGGKYVLTVTEPTCGIIARDTAIVSATSCILPYYPPSSTGKVTKKIGSELTSLVENFGSVTDDAKTIFLLRSDSILVDIIAVQGQVNALKNLLISSYGLRDTVSNGPNSLIITGWFPISNLTALNNLSSVNYCRPAFPAISNNSGIAKTQGDSAMRTNFVRDGFHVDGDSIKVGVLSDSYNTLPGDPASIDVSNGDLPGNGNPVDTATVQVVKEYPFGRRSDEGRAMLQIIHDVAPKAKLAFRTGFLTAGDFAQGIRELASNNCKVIVDDITFITEPFFRPGVVESSIQAVTATGVSYVTAAGNFGAKSYEGIFRPAAGAPPSGLTGKAHDFGGGDIFQNDSLKGTVLTPGIYTIVLQWEDDIYSLGGTTGTVNDLDIYLTDDNGVTLFGFNRNNIGGDPIEVLPFTVLANTATIILIVNASASPTATTSNIRFKYVVFRGDLKINEFNTGNSTIVGQGNAPDAITVGAALYSNTPAYGVSTPTIASFSSRGGTPVNNVVRNKPDVVAPNGVNTSVDFGSIDYEGDNLPNFFGTSAAAPHVAGAIALMAQAKKRFNNQVLTPANAKSLLTSTAIDMDAPGFDFTTGYGFVNIDSAMRTIANPTPQVISLELADSSLVPGVQPMDLIIHGNYFTTNGKVLFGTDTLAAVIQNNTTAVTTLPAFSDQKLISVYTAPKSSSGLDGGLSNSISIMGMRKKLIEVIANNKTKKYGEQMPTYSVTILVDHDSIQHTAYTPEELGLGSALISYTTPATPFSNVATYFIRPSRIFDPNNPADVLLTQKYNYDFKDGLLFVQKLPVTVVPRDTTLVYGQKIGDIHYNYQYDPAVTISDPAALFNVVNATHQSLLANDVIGLINGQAVTIVNGQAIPIVNRQAVTIVNGQAVTIVNGQAIPIVNSQALTIVNGQAVTIVNSLTDAQVANTSFMVSAASIQNARQLTNNVLVNGNYETQTTKVVDFTQESYLDFLSNPSQTDLLTSVTGASAKGVVSASALMNGQAVTIVNGQAVTIVNGQAVTIVNGQAVTIVNGQAVTIVNSLTSTSNKTGVIIDQGDIGPNGPASLKSINLITGLKPGDQRIIPGALLNDNLDVRYAAGTVHILPAAITIKAKDSSKIYGQAMTLDPARFTVSSGNLQFGDAIASVKLQSNGTGAAAHGGQYAIIPSAAVGVEGTDMNNYTINYSNGTLTVGKAALLVTAKDTSRIYGVANPVFTAGYAGFVNNQNFSTASISGTPSLTSTAGLTAAIGTYPIVAITGTLSSTDYAFSFANGTLTVNKASLTVKADDKVIFQGDPLPAFTGTITGLKNNDAAAYTYVPQGYTGNAGLYTITPVQGNFPNKNNYSITTVNGTLYVNPKGQGAKKLRPYLDCVEVLPNPSSPSRAFVAHFFCENTNATPVYVPIGVDNKLTAAGSYDGSQQPVLFLPGTTLFDVPFDGNTLTWELRTFESNKKTSVASQASSTSNKCNFTYVNAGRNAVPVEETKTPNVKGTVVYPNPARDKVTITIQNEMINTSGMLLFDVNGRKFPVVISNRISDSQVELDLSTLNTGVYFIQIKLATGNRTVRIIKTP